MEAMTRLKTVFKEGKASGSTLHYSNGDRTLLSLFPAGTVTAGNASGSLRQCYSEQERDLFFALAQVSTMEQLLSSSVRIVLPN